jgi:hypothetical protein
MNEEFPKDAKDFIHQHIHSVAQLEVLLALHREPDRRWTVEEMTGSLYLQPQMVADLLQDLARRGFAGEENGVFRYRQDRDDIRAIMDRLAQLYKERRVAVAAEIFAAPADSARAFAAAFRLRGKE